MKFREESSVGMLIQNWYGLHCRKWYLGYCGKRSRVTAVVVCCTIHNVNPNLGGWGRGGNFRTSVDIDMRLGPVTKLDKRNKATSKKFYGDVMPKNCDVIVYSRFLTNLEQTRGRIPDSVKLMSSVIVTFCLTKTGNRTKKSLSQLSHYCLK